MTDSSDETVAPEDGYRHVGSLAPYGHDGMGWLGGVDIYVKAEDYDRHTSYEGDAHRLWADNTRLRRALERARSEIDRWGYGDFHYGNTPRDQRVLDALIDIDRTLAEVSLSDRDTPRPDPGGDQP
jgi:hypothetical protein